MDETTAKFLKKSIMKCPLNHMMAVLKAWGFLTDSQLKTLSIRPKAKVVQEILDFCEEVPANGNHAAALDLVYNHLLHNRRHWQVYKMSRSSDGEADVNEVAQFKHMLKSSLKSIANVTVHFKEFDNAQWIRIAWGSAYKRPDQYNPTFVIYYSQTPFLFITGLRKTCRQLLFQALAISSKYNRIQDMDLTGRCLESLKQIVFQLCNQHFQTYNPKPRQERSFVPEIEDSRVTYENKNEKQRIQSWTREVFGDGAQPKLEFAQYKLDTMFKNVSGTNILEHKEDPFRCVVKFSSPHLLESLKLLAPSGIAEPPLSQLLTCIPSKARNHFRIGDKRVSQAEGASGS